MQGFDAFAGVGQIGVSIVNGRGRTPEELAAAAIDKIVYVGDQSHPLVTAQAHAFKDRVHQIVLYYLCQAVAEHNTTIANRLTEAGHSELVAILKD
jgi:hypothetical protein